MSVQRYEQRQGQVEPRAHLPFEGAVAKRPDKKAQLETTERTRAAIERMLAEKNQTGPKPQTGAQVFKLTGADNRERLVRVSEAEEDPFEPPRHKARKVPRVNTEAPAPILRSPPPKVTPEEQREWLVPPCVSNWRNNRGYAVPLDKRLAADARRAQEDKVNDKFAHLAESLYIADKHAREEVQQRAAMQERIAEKEKQAKEAELRDLALRKRAERAQELARERLANERALTSALGDYNDAEDDADDPTGAKQRDAEREMRREMRERDARLARLSKGSRAKAIAELEGRTISDRVAAGLSYAGAGPSGTSDEDMHDPRLYNKDTFGAFADEDSYAIYDKPLFQPSSTSHILQANRGRQAARDPDDILNPENLEASLATDRFGLLGKAPEHSASHKENDDAPAIADSGDVDIDHFIRDATRAT